MVVSILIFIVGAVLVFVIPIVIFRIVCALIKPVLFVSFGVLLGVALMSDDYSETLPDLISTTPNATIPNAVTSKAVVSNRGVTSSSRKTPSLSNQALEQISQTAADWTAAGGKFAVAKGSSLVKNVAEWSTAAIKDLDFKAIQAGIKEQVASLDQRKKMDGSRKF